MTPAGSSVPAEPLLPPAQGTPRSLDPSWRPGASNAPMATSGPFLHKLSVTCPFLPGGREEPGQTDPLDHPVLRPADVQPAAAELHAAGAAGEGLRPGLEGAEHQQGGRDPEKATGQAERGPEPARQAPRLTWLRAAPDRCARAMQPLSTCSAVRVEGRSLLLTQ